MSGGLETHLLAGAKREKEMPLYVLVFPNVFTAADYDKNASASPPELDVSIARERIKLILSSTNHSFSASIQSRLSWCAPSYPYSNILKKTFQRDVISMVLWLIEKVCGITTKMYQSRDDDEVFCLLYCDEALLRKRASNRRYRLQMRKPEKCEMEKYKFMRVFPYVKFSEAIKNTEVLKHYDEDGMETTPSPNSSLFSHVDKTRLTFGLLSSVLSLANLEWCEVLNDHYTVNSNLHLNELKSRWATFSKLFSSQPISKLQRYFGERVALYFAWIGFYLQFMIVCAVVGLGVFVVGRFREEEWAKEGYRYALVGFSMFLTLWGTFFDQLWARMEKTLAWKWGTINFSQIEDQRAEFKGKLKLDPVTGKHRKISQSSALKMFKYSISLLVSLIFMGVVVTTVMYQVVIRETLGLSPMTYGMMTAVQIKVMNFAYNTAAGKLNNWENHETESEFSEALSVKLFLFRFVNCYVSLFYIAFMKLSSGSCSPDYCVGIACPAKQCFDELATQLGWIFATNVSLNVLELGMPYIKDTIRVYLEERSIRRRLMDDPELRVNMSPTECQAKAERYETPMEDYMEMVCQYGYVIMFASSFPLVPVLALIEILLEIRVDAWKLCNLTRRPFPQRAETIGVWYTIIQVVSFMGVTVNVALILFTTNTFFLSTPFEKWLYFIVIEHALLLLKLIVSMVIPDVPNKVVYGLQWADRLEEELDYAKTTDIAEEVKLELLRRSGDREDSFRLREEQLAS